MARNEALHREVNERIREVETALSARGVGGSHEDDEYFCECGLLECVEKIRMTSAEYEQVRASPIRFAVLAEHVVPDVERVVDDRDRFVVVEKHAGERAIALETDPRA